MTDKILVTGGAGYIGSHTVLALLNAGFEVVVLDNLCNSSPESLRRVSQLAGRSPLLVEGDIRDAALLERLFADHRFSAVVHFAGLKAVGDSVRDPLAYYDNNVAGSVVLAQAAARAGVFRLVFSSSATVYGSEAAVPYVESAPLGAPSNPYGWSKLMVERVWSDLAASDPRWSVALLRYFNPIGAHESGQIGEDPSGVPNNLVPYMSQVAVGQRAELSVFGGDYPTADGTGVRDYIHVMDLADGHLKALLALGAGSGLAGSATAAGAGVKIWNLGTGVGYSVLELVRAFEAASGRQVPYKIVGRREGDLAKCWASTEKSESELGWQATRDLQTMMADTWRWQSLNPTGFKGA